PRARAARAGDRAAGRAVGGRGERGDRGGQVRRRDGARRGLRGPDPPPARAARAPRNRGALGARRCRPVHRIEHRHAGWQSGFRVTRVPHPVFFAGLTFFAALVPGGAPAVCIFAALVLLVNAHAYTALFLGIWALLVVSMVDNVVKPYVMKGDVEMHAGVLFFSLIGGLAAFGMTGLMLGPLAIALFLALLRIYRRDYGPAD